MFYFRYSKIQKPNLLYTSPFILQIVMNHGLIVNYSDTDSEEGEENQKKFEVVQEKPPPAKKIKLPNPLKNIITPNDDDEIIDDPALHDHRVRSFPHVRGNWATYIFIQPKDLDFSQIQQELLEFFKLKQNLDVKPIENPHLSVSKVVTLQHIWIKDFTTSLQEKLKTRLKTSFRLRIIPNIKILVNEEKTRTFICIEIDSNSYLRNLVKCCDQTLLEFQKEPFYDPPEFHISLAWILGDNQNNIVTKHLIPIAQNWLDSQDQTNIEVNSVHCKIGNKLFDLKI